MTSAWPPVLSLDTPLPTHLCPEVGRGLLVIPEDATEAGYAETEELLTLVEWVITDVVLGINDLGHQIVELRAEPTGLLTDESVSGGDEQLMQRAGLTD